MSNALTRKILLAERLGGRGQTDAYSEDYIHGEVVKALRANGVWFWHTANERKTTARHGAKLKAMGVSSGIPDLIIIKIGHPPYALELKSDRGRLSVAQKDWLSRMGLCGWYTAVAFGLEQAMGILRAWGVIK